MSIRWLSIALLTLALAAPASAIPDCSNGGDDDLDGLGDYPFDPGCYGPDDDDEYDPALVCDDRVDADGDFGTGYGLWRGWDFGCTDPTDPSEKDPALPCDDGIDNDGDGLVDFAEDPGCLDAATGGIGDTESPACNDGADNDGDGATDMLDPGCVAPGDDDESGPCENGLDDDGDGAIDLADAGCDDATGESEAPACDDGADDDGDGLVDFPDDPGCASGGDVTETDASFPCDDGVGLDFPMDPSCSSPTDPTDVGATECDDGLDNDGDGRVDLSDNGCFAESDLTESPACDDGIDNDGDGLVDSTDPGCRMGWVDRELAACADGADNDGDGLVDFPDDPDCADANGREIDADPSKLSLLVDAVGNPAADGQVYHWIFDDLHRVAPDGSLTLLATRSGDGAGHVIDGGFGPLVDRQGNLYLGAWRSANLFRLSPGGVLEQLIGPRDQGPDVNRFTGGWALGPDDAVYLASGSASPNTIFRVDPSGDVTLANDPTRLHVNVRDHAVGPDGTLYLAIESWAERVRPSVVAVSPSGEIRTVIDDRGDGVHPLQNPRRVAVDARGNVWVVGELSDNVFRIAPDGTATQMIDREGDRAGNWLRNPQRMELDRRGNAWVSDRWGHLFLVTRGGAILEIAETVRTEIWAIPTHDDVILLGDEVHTWVYDRDPECSNGLDDDGDGFADHPEDPGCRNALDDLEEAGCSNGFDDDGDGLTDFPADPGCGGPRADLEDPQCANGLDDDGDGHADFPADPGCVAAFDDIEDPECDDGVDNDGDDDVDGADSQCASPADISEGCGLGAELALLLPVLMRLRRRRAANR